MKNQKREKSCRTISSLSSKIQAGFEKSDFWSNSTRKTSENASNEDFNFNYG